MPELAIGAGASILGGILGSNAAGNAADAQKEAAQKAEQTARANQQSSTDYQTGVSNQQRQDLNPFLQAGQGAVSNLSQLLGPGGQLTKGYQDFQAPTGVTEQNDPGYQFRLQQGMSALQNSAAARGGLLSGGTAKAINDYAQNSASNEYGNVYGRALQSYQTNQGNFNTNNNNLYGRLSGLAGQGLQAGATLGGLSQAGAQNITGINNAATQAVTQQQNNQGAAQASGIIGGANSWLNALGGVSNSIGGGLASFNQSGYGGGGNSNMIQVPGVQNWNPGSS